MSNEVDSTITFIAITVHQDALLFLKRTQAPLCWGPPSGHVKIDEPIEQAIAREMAEETGLACKILMPVSVWQGKHRGRQVLNITYVCMVNSSKIELSEEHSDYRWVPIKELEHFQKETILDLKEWPLFIQLAKLYDENK